MSGMRVLIVICVAILAQLISPLVVALPPGRLVVEDPALRIMPRPALPTQEAPGLDGA